MKYLIVLILIILFSGNAFANENIWWFYGWWLNNFNIKSFGWDWFFSNSKVLWKNNNIFKTKKTKIWGIYGNGKWVAVFSWVVVLNDENEIIKKITKETWTDLESSIVEKIEKNPSTWSSSWYRRYHSLDNLEVKTSELQDFVEVKNIEIETKKIEEVVIKAENISVEKTKEIANIVTNKNLEEKNFKKDFIENKVEKVVKLPSKKILVNKKKHIVNNLNNNYKKILNDVVYNDNKIAKNNFIEYEEFHASAYKKSFYKVVLSIIFLCFLFLTTILFFLLRKRMFSWKKFNDFIIRNIEKKK